MHDRSDEIIKQLNRLANDRTLAPIARNKLHDAVQHIRDMQQQLRQQAEIDLGLDAAPGGETAAEPGFNPLESLLPRSRQLLRASLGRH